METDPRLADYARLTDMELRTQPGVRAGAVHRGGDEGDEPGGGGRATRSAPSCWPNGGWPISRPCSPRLATAGAPVYVVPDETAERLTGYRVHRGALASLHRKPLPEIPALAAGGRTVIVLEDLVDHANVGAIFRCAAALGVDAIFLSPRCADPLYRRAVKVSMGAVFAIPYARMTGSAVRRPGRPEGGRVPAARADAGRHGRAAEARRQASGSTSGSHCCSAPRATGCRRAGSTRPTRGVRIPMHPGALAAGVDSLNVVAAAAIACHVLGSGDETRSVG